MPSVYEEAANLTSYIQNYVFAVVSYIAAEAYYLAVMR